MIRTGTIESARANRRHLGLANGTGFWRSDLIASARGGPQPGPWAPQAFLVEQDPDSAILPHYHQENEFQVVVEGDGSFGRHAVRPVTVHYAGRHTGYGPINSGKQGLWYFSLRAFADPGARFLPETRAQMENGPKRHILGEPVAPCGAAELRGTAHAGIETAIKPQPDGIAAWMLRVPPRAVLQPPAHPAGAARFYLVISGELQWQDECLPRFAAAFVASNEKIEAETRFTPLAGDGGLQLLCAQFPC